MTHSSELTGRAKQTQRILVTGATGKQGGGLARILIQRGHHVRAFTRTPESPAALALKTAGAEVVQGDLGEIASVERAAKGMDVAYIVATPFQHGPAAETRFATTGVDGARAGGVPYIVYSSVSDADRETGIPHFESKALAEAHLKGTGTDYSIISPVFFVDNLLSPWMGAGLAKGTLAMGVAPDRKLQSISVAEIAEFTTLAVEQRQAFRGKRINIGSDETTPVEMARLLSESIGQKISYFQVPLEEMRKQNEDLAKMNDWFNRVGYSVNIPQLKRDYPQVHWGSFRDWVKAQDWKEALAASTGPGA